MKPVDLLQQLNALDEHPRIEAKAGSDIGKSMLETVCAFANEPGLDGGWLLLGVTQDQQAFWKQYEVVGVDDPDKIQADLASQCAQMFNIPVRPQCEVAEIRGRRVIAVRVPEAPASAKPVYFASRGLPAGAFRRIGSSDVRCTEEDLAVFYADRPGQSLDLGVLPDGELDEIDRSALADYRRLRAEANPADESLAWGDEDLLRALRCAGRDARGVLRPTAAGVLLFGTTLGLRRHFPMMRVDYIRVPGRQWVEDPSTRFETLELRAPLVRLVTRALAAILDDLPKAFSLPADGVQRRDVPRIPARVLREAVVNAVMHRSYRVHGPVQLIRYSNRLEIRNPGYSLVAEERWGEPGSVSRNPHIAAVLHELNYAETKGSGIRVMRALMREAGLTPPTFESDRQKNLFVATFLFHHFLGPEDWTWLRSLAVEDLTDEEARALVYMRETFSLDNAAYRDLNQVDALNASQHLRRLRDHGLFEQRGRGSATFYIPTPRFIATLDEPVREAPALSGKPAGLSGNPSPLSGNPPALSGNPAPLSGNPAASAAMPEALSDALVNLGKRASRPDMENLVVRLCAWRALNADQLATYLQRTRKHTLDGLITPLLRAGRLAMTLPEQPNHPQQTYRATEGAE